MQNLGLFDVKQEYLADISWLLYTIRLFGLQ